ncbi:ClpX C4-type zinc finger protein [Bacillus sp. SL00103]
MKECLNSTRKRSIKKCSFCGKTQDQVRKLVAGRIYM